MSLADYLRLLDWTGRQLRRDKRGAIPSHVTPILHRLKITDDGNDSILGGDGDDLLRGVADRDTLNGRQWQR
jgi:hypothetical protein